MHGGITQDKFAAMIGLSQSGYSKLEGGEQNASQKSQEKICSFFGLEWHEILRQGADIRNGLFPGESIREKEPEECVSIPLRETVASMGGGSTLTGNEAVSDLFFRSDWIRSKGGKDKKFLIQVSGDSMAPVVRDQSVVLIDERRVALVAGRIFFVRHNGELFLKRLEGRIGEIRLVSENGQVETPVREGEDFEIIGMAIWAASEI